MMTKKIRGNRDGDARGDNLFLPLQRTGIFAMCVCVCVGIFFLTSKKFTDVCVAGKWYRLVTLICCQELVSFTSSMLVSYGSCKTLFIDC